MKDPLAEMFFIVIIIVHYNNHEVLLKYYVDCTHSEMIAFVLFKLKIFYFALCRLNGDFIRKMTLGTKLKDSLNAFLNYVVILSQKQSHLQCKVCFNHIQSLLTPEWQRGFFPPQIIPPRGIKTRSGPS